MLAQGGDRLRPRATAAERGDDGDEDGRDGGHERKLGGRSAHGEGRLAIGSLARPAPGAS
jgi:hypothetical protein